MMFRLVFQICFLVLTLWSGYAEATFIAESEIQTAYNNYKKKYGQGQVFESISPAVAFANWYYQTTHEKNPDGAADALHRILFTGEGVGGISKTHRATPIETSFMLSLAKNAKPSGTTKIPLGIDAAERAHQEFLNHAMDVFSSPGENTPIKEWTDAIDRLVKWEGFPSANKRLTTQIKLGERTNLILYKALLSHKRLDPISLLKAHPEIRQCFTILNQLSVGGATHLFYQAPVKESLFGELSSKEQSAFALTSKWGRQIRDDLQETLTFTKKNLPQPEVAVTVGKRFQRATRFVFRDIDFTNSDNMESFRILVQDKTTSLTIHSCKGLLGLIAHFPPFKNLQTLDLDSNFIGADGIQAWVSKLPPGLQTLNLSYNMIGIDGIRALAGKLPAGLQTLNLANNLIGDDGIRALADKLPPGLQSLNLADNNIVSIRELADKLPPGLQTLDLGHNLIGDDGIGTLVDKLPAGLKTLNLARSMIRVNALVGKLPADLQTLDLSDNAIKADGIRELADNLPAGLQNLNLDGNYISDDGIRILADKLPPGLQTLNLANNGIGDDGIRELADNLPADLKTLNLDGNNIGDDGIRALADKLPPGLQTLNLRRSNIGADGIRILADKLPHTKVILKD